VFATVKQALKIINAPAPLRALPDKKERTK
jgi:hypothetical protein